MTRYPASPGLLPYSRLRRVAGVGVAAAGIGLIVFEAVGLDSSFHSIARLVVAILTTPILVYYTVTGRPDKPVARWRSSVKPAARFGVYWIEWTLIVAIVVVVVGGESPS